MTYKLLLLPGDGIGPEVTAEVERVLNWFQKHRGFAYTAERALVGGAALEAEGAPVSKATMQLALDADAILFGAVGGPNNNRRGLAATTRQKPLGATHATPPHRPRPCARPHARRHSRCQ